MPVQHEPNETQARLPNSPNSLPTARPAAGAQQESEMHGAGPATAAQVRQL